MKRLLQCAVLLIFLCASAVAQMQIVELADPQVARSIAGVVVDPTSATIPRVLVEEYSSDWKSVLRSTYADEKGKFRLSSKRKQKLYYLQFGCPGFNWVRLTIRLDSHGVGQLTVKLPIGT